MKHAFLIIAHNNWWQLEQLMRQLDHPDNYLFIHIDKKSKDFRQYRFAGVLKHSEVVFYQEYEVFWGGYSQVQTEMLLFKEAASIGFDYYHIMSGGDLLLKPMSEFHRFFEENKGKEFIEYDDHQLKSDPEISRRTRLYHYLQNYRRRYKVRLFNEFFTFCERVSLVLQILCRVNRTKDLDWEIKYGSNWVSITDDLVAELIRQQDKIEKVFSHTNSGDELFVQTVAWNCGFKDRIYTVNDYGYTDNKRLVDWMRGSNGNPYTFRRDDLKFLRCSDALIARKFSETVDREIIEIICGLRDPDDKSPCQKGIGKYE